MSSTSSILAAAVLLGSVVSAADAQRLGRIEPGEPFPDLVLPSMEDGSPTSIADFRGRRVMLQVFASW